jgi:hypothetical protein
VVNEDHHHHHRRVVRKLAESTRSADSEPGLGSPLKNDHHQVSKLGGSNRKEFGSENRNDPVCDGVNKPGFPEPPKENSEKKSTNPVRVIEKSTASDVKSKIFIRIRTKSKSDADAGDDGAAEATDQTISAAAAPDSDEPAPKTWNLRPRKPAPKRPNADGGAPEAVGAPAQDTKTQPLGHAEPSRARNGTDTKVSKKRPRLSISLSKEEIEEDVFVFTGSKPARRPKKRPRNVQKQLDVINLQAQDFGFFFFFYPILIYFVILIIDFFFFFGRVFFRDCGWVRLRWRHTRSPILLGRSNQGRSLFLSVLTFSIRFIIERECKLV